MKAIIIGGGIGGLCTALSLNKAGWHTQVLEQSPAINEIGAGIQISPNGVKVLRALGLDKAVEQQAFAPQFGQFRGGHSGRVIATMQMGDHMDARYGAPYWHVHRSDLICIFVDALSKLNNAVLTTNAQVTGYGQNGERAWATLADGDRVEGDIIIGADGIKSVVREQMLGKSEPHFTGNVAWRAVVSVSDLGRHVPPPGACVWLGEGKHAVTYLIKRGTMANLVGVVERDDWTAEGWSEQATKKEAMRDFMGWHPTIRKIIDKADSHYRWALFDREPLSQWHDGRAILLGDACHPMLPFMAQGAVMAMEDAYVLAQALSQNNNLQLGMDDVAAAFDEYYQTRHPRTAQVQKQSRANMGLFHQRTLRGKLKNYTPLWLASRAAPNIFDERNDWLYGHDVTN